MHGRTGEDVSVDVPEGTVVRDAESDEILGELLHHGQTLQVAKGGKGGLGNVHFKSSTNQAPHFAEKGEPGQERWLDLELKLIADVGIVGLPNAGKSTLLSVISAAKPKIADYPFTTLSPNLGVVSVGDSTFVAADIPGLIEGAHEGVGLGHEFLRHIERTLVLVHLLDGAGPDPLAAFEQVNDELRQYHESLTSKPQIVAVGKMDLPEARDRWPVLKGRFSHLGYEAIAISALTREGVDRLIARTSDVLHEERTMLREAEPDEIPVIAVKPHPDRIQVERKRRTFYVTGETVERLAVMTDLESAEALHRLQQRLKRMGVLNALQRAGITEGSKVRIGEVEFVWNSFGELGEGEKPGGKAKAAAERRKG
jgi:GTP-binding protein